ncbi:MAG: M14 family zinc carboxypeptidase, partial [Gemmatimonadota bacterium]
MTGSRAFAFALLLALVPASAVAQSGDEAYAEKIREYTTDPRFLSDLVDHLPESETVPSPLEHFGTIIGAPEILHTTDEIHGYMRALAQTSPRVVVRAIGHSEEAREMIEVIIADEATIENLESYRAALNRLADPRTLSDEEARQLISRAKPIYYFTAGLHSPETGPPEMVMELAYRLAVEESPMIRAIRDGVITVIVPVTEPDGRDRMADAYRYRKANRDVGPGLRYWGKYVAHDNNRDGYGLGLALTRNILDAYFHWKPTVMHDLHESGYYLYTSTGTGPYNEQIDALTIDEWHNLAHEEVTELTKRGMPGVWTHAFYTGWAANYLMWIANTRNSIGRFYETLGNGGAATRERELPERATSREWY